MLDAIGYQQRQALSVIQHWYAARKCHRIDQLFADNPYFAAHVAIVYQNFMRQDGHNEPLPSKCDIANTMVQEDFPGFTHAVLAYDRTLQHAARSR